MKQIKVSEDVHEKLKEIAERQGCSINDVIKMMLNIYLGGTSERAIDKIVSKEFVADSEKVCSKCKRRIEVGEIVYWVKYIYTDGGATTRYFCIECANPHLAKIYKKKKEMEIVVKQLKREADRLIEEINKLEHVRSVYTIKNEIIQFWREFKSTFIDNPDYKVVEQFLDKLNELIDKVNRLEAMVTSPLTEVDKRKVKKEMYVERLHL
jgi:Ribbon-helix-helix protein, copG family.